VIEQKVARSIGMKNPFVALTAAPVLRMPRASRKTTLL
jgi:hypothetical protein